MRNRILTTIGIIMFTCAGVPAFAQGAAAVLGMAANQQSQAKKQETAAAKGMVWHYLERLKQRVAELEKQIPERDNQVTALEKETKDGDKNLVRLYLRRVVSAERDVVFNCDGVIRDLQEFDRSAGNALENKNGFNLDGYMSEAEYREALKTARRTQELVKSEYLNVGQMKVWDAALKTPGIDSQYFKVPQPPQQTATSASK